MRPVAPGEMRRDAGEPVALQPQHLPGKGERAIVVVVYPSKIVGGCTIFEHLDVEWSIMCDKRAVLDE